VTGRRFCPECGREIDRAKLSIKGRYECACGAVYDQDMTPMPPISEDPVLNKKRQARPARPAAPVQQAQHRPGQYRAPASPPGPAQPAQPVPGPYPPGYRPPYPVQPPPRPAYAQPQSAPQQPAAAAPAQPAPTAQYAAPQPAYYRQMQSGPVYRQVVKTSGIAIGALVLGIVSFVGLSFCIGGLLGPFASLMGVLGLREIQKDPDRLGGKGMAIAGIVLGVISSLAMIAMGALVAFAGYADGFGSSGTAYPF